MANDEEIVIRARDFKMSPDVELYVEILSKKGVLEKLNPIKNFFDMEWHWHSNIGRVVTSLSCSTLFLIE